MSFQKAIRLSDVPEQGVAKAKVGTQDLAIIRKDGKVYALDGTCSHEGGPLGEGTLDGDELVCPWHEGRYRISTGEANPETEWVTDVKSFRTKVEEGYVWVDL